MLISCDQDHGHGDVIVCTQQLNACIATRSQHVMLSAMLGKVYRHSLLSRAEMLLTDLTSRICRDALMGASMISPPFARCLVFRNSAGADR